MAVEARAAPALERFWPPSLTIEPLDGRPSAFDTVSMLRALAFVSLIGSLVGADGGGLDAGAIDAGAGDAGLTDAGAADGGPPKVTASWVHADGGFLTDAGVSDRVVVPVGGFQEVRFPHPLLAGQCDDPDIARIDGSGDTLIFRGLVPGHTFCGFWFYRQAWPNRYVELTVVGDAPPVEVRPKGRPEFHR
jgi:hypothetical protein